MKPIVKTLAAGPLFVLAACAQTDPSVGFADPYENGNRKMHEFNKGLDTTVIRPVATAYGTVLPRPIRQGVSNIASNLGEPGNVVNNVLQGRVEDALHNTTRFLFNSTIGIAGTFDVASAMGLEERETDFGETLHVWGAQEGAYLEVPFVGPSTERDAIGKAVDIVLNPIDTMFHKDVSTVQAATNVGSRRASAGKLCQIRRASVHLPVTCGEFAHPVSLSLCFRRHYCEAKAGGTGF